MLWAWAAIFLFLAILLGLYPKLKKLDSDYIKTQDLYVLISKGDDAGVFAYVASGKDVSLRSVLGLTPMHLAASLGRVGALKALVLSSDSESGGTTALYQIRRYTWFGATPLFMAALFQQSKVIAYFSNRNISLNERGWYGESALHWAFSSELTANRLATVKALVLGGCDIRVATWLGQTPLHFASREGCLSELNVLLKSLVKTSNNITQSSSSSSSSDNAIDELAIESSKDYSKNKPQQVNPSNGNSKSLDSSDSSDFFSSGVSMIVSDRINGVDATDWLGRGALHFACARGHLDIAVRLISIGQADVNLRSWYLGQTPLHVACNNDFADIAYLLLTNGARTDVLNWQRSGPLEGGAVCQSDSRIALFLKLSKQQR